MNLNFLRSIPVNRIVAFGGPYIAIASGFLATWLGSHITFLHLFANHDATANQIVKALTFLAGTAVTWALHSKWLTGWQAHEARQADQSNPHPAEVLAGTGVPSGDLPPGEVPVVLPADVPTELETPPAPPPAA